MKLAQNLVGRSLPGDRYVAPKGRLARQLLSNAVDTSPTDEFGAIARLVQAGIGTYMQNKDAEQQKAADDAFVKGLSAEPWQDPDAAARASGELPKLNMDNQRAGGIDGALHAVSQLGDGNAYAGPLSKRLALMQFEDRRAKEALAGKRAYDDYQRLLDEEFKLKLLGMQHRNAMERQNSKPTDSFETVQNPYGRGGVGQKNTTTGEIVNYQKPKEAGGPFDGTSMDAQALNILLQGDPSSPQYQAAYAHYGRPKVTFDPQSGQQVTVTPDMSPFRPPASASPQAQPQVSAQPSSAPAPAASGQPGVSVAPVASAPARFSDSQGKAAGFADRMTSANSILNNLENKGTEWWDRFASEELPFGNYLVDDEFQKFDQARRDFINAQLRRESGAVISPEEFANAERQYFPVPGDSADVIDQKRKARQIALEGMRRDAGPSYQTPTQMPDDVEAILKQMGL